MGDANIKGRGGLSRREFLKVGTAGVVTGTLAGSGLAGTAFAGPGAGKGPPALAGPPGTGGGAGDLGLVNGKFVDGRGEVANAITIKDGRIANVGQLHGLGPDAKVINLKGRTVIPGFVNGHVHHSRTGTNAGHEVRDIETAFSIAEVQELLARRAATVPAGEWIGCHLGWHYVQLAENRAPNRAELDDAAPNHRVFLSGRAGHVEPFFSVTNSLGQQFFESQGFTVDSATGRVSGTPEQAFNAIRNLESDEDRLRQTFDNNQWTLSLGCTTVLDPAGSAVTPRAYPAYELLRQGKLDVRHRLYRSAGTNVTAIENRLQNSLRHMGNDLFREGGFGETIGNRNNIPGTFVASGQPIAEFGWKIQHHTDFFSQVDELIDAFQTIAAVHPIENLRWQLIHAFQVTEAQAQMLKNLGVAVDLENERYLDRAERGGGPPFRLLLDSGINIGVGTDGSNWAPNNPWLMMYYMTTGVSVTGVPNNTDQIISRMEALRLFTEGSAFISFDDNKLGGFDVGKYADLAVLSDDFRTVSDADLRKIRSVMTLVDGKIVHQGNEPEYAPMGTEFSYLGFGAA